MEQTQKHENGFMVKLATFIVDKRDLFFLIVIIGLIFSAFSRNWVGVENDLSFYLPDDAETRLALDVMEDQFTTYGTAEVMVANITYEDAAKSNDQLSEVKGVQSVAFDQTTDHYASSSALFTVTFDYDETGDACLDALDAVKELLSDYDLYISTDLGDTLAETIDSEVSVIMVYVAVIVVIVLILTSRTFGEVPVLLLTFVAAMILDQGTNFLLGRISFVSNSVTSILQLALSLDYAVILCNRFKEEHKTLPIREAAIQALSKAIPEIGASSLTTIGGLCAMLFMQFKIGPDMGICLMKSILFALLSVFVLMPGLLVLFGPLIEKTEHRNFVPKISFAGKVAWATRKIVPFVFLAVTVLGYFVSSKCPYVYGYSMPHREAMIETLDLAFPTVITSGTILSVAGILIGQMTSEAAIVGIGQSLGRGTILSMLLVLFVLPQILLLGGGLADKTSFSMPSAVKQKEGSGKVFINGFVSGEICGTISGMVRANVDGMVNLNVISGSVENGLPGSKQEEAKNGSDHKEK